MAARKAKRAATKALRTATKALRTKRAAKGKEARAELPDLGDELLGCTQAHEQRTRELIELATPIRSREAVLLELLHRDVSANHSGFRRLFPGRLQGIDDDQIARVGGVIRVALEAFETGDVEALEIVGGVWERLAGTDGKYTKVQTLVRVLTGWLDGFRKYQPTDDEAFARSLPTIFRIANLDKSLPMPEDRVRRLIAKTREIVEHGPGYGERNARGLASWLIDDCKAFGVTTDAQAESLVKDALQQAKKDAAKSPSTQRPKVEK